jgi:UDP-glucose 4-epimerase
VHLSWVALLGSAIDGAPELTEALPARPVSLYGIGKFAAERTLERLADLWSLDAVSLRLSAVYGPWEHATGVRDSLSPHAQIRAAALAGRPALLARPGRRDWLHGEDVGSAVMAVAQAPKLPHRLYNVTTPHETTALEFGRALGRHVPGFECRLAAAGEAPTIDLHLPVDRPPLSPHRLATDLGWQARVDVEAAVAAMITALGRTAPPLA